MSDAAYKACNAFSIDEPAFYHQDMIPTKISVPDLNPNPEEADDTKDEDIAEDFHDRYVKLRDALAS